MYIWCVSPSTLFKMDILRKAKRRKEQGIRKVSGHVTDHVMQESTCTLDIHIYTVPARLKITSVTLWAEIKEEVDWYYRHTLE